MASSQTHAGVASSSQSQQKAIKIYTSGLIRHLQALGFDSQTMSEKHNIAFNPQMFVKPNAKAFEVIVHFLLCQLDPDRAGRLFAQCWPPFCKETIREFKDAIFNWLSELAPSVSATSAGAKSNAPGTPTIGKPSQQTNQNPSANKLLSHIKFPPVTKSLLAVPCGLKTCELLYSLVTYVVLSKTIRIAGVNKSNVRIYPKVSPLHSTVTTGKETASSTGKQPFNPTSTNSLNWAAHTSKFTSQKQANQFNIQTWVLQQMSVRNLDYSNKFIAKKLETRAKYQFYLRKGLEEISNLLEMKASKSEMVVNKRKLLCSELGLNDTNHSLETLIKRFKESKLAEFEWNLLEMSKTNDRTFENSARKEQIDEVINGYDTRAELNGQDMIDFLSGDVLQSVAESLNSSSCGFYETDFEEVLKENRTKLDMINLARLKKMLISQKIESGQKINMGNLVSMVCSMNETMNSDQSFNMSSFVKNRVINEEMGKLKKKLDSVGPKVKDHLDELVKSLLASGMLDESEPEYMQSEVIAELNRLDEKFYAMLNRKIPFDPKLIEEARTKSANSSGDRITNPDVDSQIQKDADIFESNLKALNMESLLATPNAQMTGLDWLGDLNKPGGDQSIASIDETAQGDDCSLGILDLDEMSEIILSDDLKTAITERDLQRFGSILDEQTDLISQLKPRIINDILLHCIRSSSPPSDDAVDFIEAFIFKLHTLKCYFVFSDDTCKSVVKLFTDQKRQFSPHSINFLLRCHDLALVKLVFDQNLVCDKCSGDCLNWHLMFVASYQERFFTHHFETIFEGFLARFILLCKLRCSLNQKRFFLTWFAGSLHLYTDEYLLQNEETRFKYVLVKLFESLILNGLLTNSDFVNLSTMLAKRNQELKNTISAKHYSTTPMLNYGNKPDAGYKSSSASYFPVLDDVFPLSLKNNCRLAIKRSMVKYTKNEIDKLPLPTNLKKFVFFEHECESVFRCFQQIKPEVGWVRGWEQQP